jgi:hypothetical protein
MLLDQERKLYLQRLQQLEQLGLAMPFGFHMVASRPREIEVEQCANEQDCPVIDLPDNRTLFVVWVSLWAERPGVQLSDFRFEPPWRDHGFVRLPNFADSHVGVYYCLPGGLEYPREDVLNVNFLKAGWRLPSIRVEGVLCALSDTPIPEGYKHGALIPVTVRFFNRAGQQLAEATVTFWADRLTHHPQKVQHTAEGRSAKPRSAPNAAAKPHAAAQPPQSSLDGPGGPELLPSPDEVQLRGTPPAARIREGGHGTGLFGD